MSDRYLDNLLPDFGEYSLESVLEDYKKRVAASNTPAAPVSCVQNAQEEPSPPPVNAVDQAQAIAQRSRQIVIEALGEAISQRGRASASSFDKAGLGALLEDEQEQEDQAEKQAVQADKPVRVLPQPKPRRRFEVSPDGIITLDLEIPGGAPEPEPEPEPEEAEVPPEEPAEEPQEATPSQPQEPPKESAADRFLKPLIRFAATKMAMRQMQKAEAANWPDPVEYEETEELSPSKAAKFYGQQIKPLRFRCRVCFFLCIVLAWICLRFPMAGMLGRSTSVQAGVSLVLLLTVMMTTLDILAAGMRQLFDLRPGCESLATLAAIMSCVDACMVLTGNSTNAPFCAVGAFSLGAALWGERLDCLARARSMRAAAISKSPSAVTAEDALRGSGAGRPVYLPGSAVPGRSRAPQRTAGPVPEHLRHGGAYPAYRLRAAGRRRVYPRPGRLFPAYPVGPFERQRVVHRVSQLSPALLHDRP